jgi:hypothetical protein
MRYTIAFKTVLYYTNNFQMIYTNVFKTVFIQYYRLTNEVNQSI